MAKRKLQRFAELKTLGNVIQPQIGYPPIDHALKGKWNADFFNNQNPIVLELGCGRGEYTVNMARHFPEKNFVGIDIKGARLWRGSKTAEEEGIRNAGFLRIPILRLESYFTKNEVSEIWITFPDPQPLISGIRKRLSSPRFLEIYQQILQPGGLIHLKTDNEGLYDYTYEWIREAGYEIAFDTKDLYQSGIEDQILSIKTTYEEKYLKIGKKICYLKFRIPGR